MVYLCIDLKCFYASVECVLRKLDPFKTDLVVADPSRGNGAICLAISPKMKARGIKNRCRMYEIPKYVKPIVAKPRMKKYIEYSSLTYGIYLKYVSKDDIHPYSIDECFLNITPYLKLYKMNEIELAKKIINDVYNTLGLTVSVGIGTNLFLSKVALDITAKKSKDNIGYLNEELFKKTLWHHKPLTDFWQIGKGIEKRLNRLGLFDMYSVSNAPEKMLYKEFGINAKYLIDHSKGIEPCTIKEIKEYKPKSHSISNSQILFEDYSYKDARIVLIEMIDAIVLRLIKEKKVTNTLGLYIGYSKDIIKPLSSHIKLDSPTNSFKVISNKLLEIYDNKINEYYKIRKIGLSLGNIEKRKYKQYDIFNSVEEELLEEKVEEAINNIKNKYGKNSILRAVSYTEAGTAKIRNSLIGGHNAE